ncbi:MAG: preprotein translocase subunit SecA [Dongiaceae bacterium]
MFSSLAKRLFGSANERYIKSHQKTVDAINALEPELVALKDDELRARTDWLRGRQGNGESLDELLPDAFATVREAAKRTLGQRHFDVQLMGGIVLHRGQIAEMKTGEGKTLVATLAVYLNALEGKGVHVVTVNDYLARRDSEWMGQVYKFLGLSVGCIVPGLRDVDRRAAYACDIAYGTNNELGFDYLRDNMKFRLEEMVQREFSYAIVDEVDSILVDEARTPLIISGQAEDSSELYTKVNALIPKLAAEDFEKDEKTRHVTLTEGGTEHAEKLLIDAGLLKVDGLYDVQNVSLVHHLNQALRAHKLFARDTDYIVKDGKVIIIDEFTGRMMEGRRYSEGLHQALEAKEHVPIQNETQTLASITFQNYFRLYPKLAGMTGTALTEAAEFQETYGLEVIEIPTNMPMIRADFDDEVYRTAKEKYDAIVTLIEECRGRGQPILVGTVSIEKSEALSEHLKKKKIPHQVLNARYHEQEAYIIAQAGVPGGVTIATNMAGRGTDIQLGGNYDMRVRQEAAAIEDDAERARKIEQIKAETAAAKEVALKAGGLYVIGTERHESRRIDNQLRGRSGRQGDPGASKFFLSLEDDLMRIFGSQRMDSMLQKLGLQDGEAIAHPWVNKALEKAQQRVEARNFDIRKELLKYDNVMNHQRKAIYEQRKDLMRTPDVSEEVAGMRHQVIGELVGKFIPENAYAEQWDTNGLHEECLRVLGLDLPVAAWAKQEGIDDGAIQERITEASNRKMAEKAANLGPDFFRMIEKKLLLDILDHLWKSHLLELDHLRHGIGLRAYGQRDPLREYQAEAFAMFEAMLDRLRENVTSVLSKVQIQRQVPEEALLKRPPRQVRETREDPAMVGAGAMAEDRPSAPPRPATVRRPAVTAGDPSTWVGVSRNAPCPCGSGKKYKYCHGKM